MRFGICSNISRDTDYLIANECAGIITELGGEVVFEKELKSKELINVKEGIVFDSFVGCDVIISIGGDGTLLSVVSAYRDLDIPFIGINKGSIGFLTDIDVPKIYDSIKKIMNGEYEILERLQLCCEVYNKDNILKDKYICLNDCVVTRGAKLNIVKMDLFIDGQYVEKFYGDGIIVSTPTGSTAYTLAAGGPILMPGMRNMIVTPLCPHTLQRSSYCISDQSVIEIKLGDFETCPIISPDGKNGVALEPYDTIKIMGNESSIKTVMLGESGFFETVRSKITARGSFYEYKK
ncbi:MAG: NAD(+)/NADH kinase [Clostridiales bacterium]|nr:NAD(+)/NADH kinase [Clostridiales bacterium]